ncbi:MAG: TrkA C-terminal domain-containing protein [Dehalococcoidia bacterium]
MQVLIALLFLVVWLLILWIGSIALEATGLDRSKSRFQALSALTGTGFTTSQAEMIVEHPKRRRITTYLILIGNTGIAAFLILLVLYLRSGITAPSRPLIVLTAIVLLILALFFFLGLIDRLTNVFLRIGGKGPGTLSGSVRALYNQMDDYTVARLTLGQESKLAGAPLKDARFEQGNITVLAIERQEGMVPHPEAGEILAPGDSLLCYGKMENIVATMKAGT